MARDLAPSCPPAHLREQKLGVSGVQEGGKRFFFLPNYKNNTHVLVFGNGKSDEEKFSHHPTAQS